MDSETSIINNNSEARLREQMCRLWQDVFGDSKDFILNYFAKYDTPATRIVRYDNAGNLIAMMHYHRFVSNETEGAYIYGVATHPDWRGRDIARQMIEESIKLMSDDGLQLAMLIAEEQSLRSWYATMNFRLLDNFTVTITGSDGMNFAMDDERMNIPMVRMIDASSHHNAVTLSHKIVIEAPSSPFHT